MGDHTQSVVGRKIATLEESKQLGERALAWLIQQEIIEHQLTDCCLVDPGYPPGRHYQRACSLEDSEAELDRAGLFMCRTNGVQLYMQRYPFVNHQGNFGPARCPCCTAARDIDAYYQACDDWLNGGTGQLHCDQCSTTEPVPDWEHDDLLCGTLGLVFWNWPGLSPNFLGELSRHIGHRVSLIQGKM